LFYFFRCEGISEKIGPRKEGLNGESRRKGVRKGGFFGRQLMMEE
jgi:hypothetical protein